MNVTQTVRRFNQQNKAWSECINVQRQQFKLIEKLFSRNGLKIKMTCSSHPEQYDVFRNNLQVAYFRLRHGLFRVDFPECGVDTIFEAEPSGDGLFDDDERFFYMAKAMRVLLKKLKL